MPTGPTLPASWFYDIDVLGRVSSITSGSYQSYFGYDDANRLVTRLQAVIDPATGQGPVGYNQYRLDNADNLLGVARTNFGANALADAAATYGVNALNQAVSNSGYDANGNLLSDGTYTYSWDARDRLVGIAVPTAVRLSASSTTPRPRLKVPMRVQGELRDVNAGCFVPWCRHASATCPHDTSPR